MKQRILQKDNLWAPLAQDLATRYEVHTLWTEPDPVKYLIERGHTFEVLVSSSRTGVTTSLIDALPHLKLISNFGVGLDSIDVARARQRGIVVGYTPKVLTNCVADLAFGLLIDASRCMSTADRFVRNGQWPTATFPVARSVSGKRLGIVGLGRIGMAVAKRASGFDMDIGYVNLARVEDVPYRFFDDLLELARWSDFLVVAAAGGPETKDLISGPQLSALGPEGVLINISRGFAVNEEALLQALETGAIRGAGLDVHTAEPHVSDRFLVLDNVVLLPHIASNTQETRRAMADLVLDNLQSFFDTGFVKEPVPD
ncbi:2-hydroxyacid dehydrogenase [Variovorax boronicumulans]